MTEPRDAGTPKEVYPHGNGGQMDSMKPHANTCDADSNGRVNHMGTNLHVLSEGHDGRKDADAGRS